MTPSTTAQASGLATPDTRLARAQREFAAICRKMDRDQEEADEREAMSDFGALIFNTAKACEGRSCEVLDRVLSAKVRAWADDQDRLSVNEARPEPANDAQKLREAL